MGIVDKLLLAVSCVFACRGLASGCRCKWPTGVDFTSRVALVTGASSGVGYGVARGLAQHGWTVILAGRDEMRLLNARRAILAGKPRGRIFVLGTVDLSDFDGVRSFAALIIEQKAQLPVSLLVNAAGVLRRHLHRCEGTGIEEMIATNVMGPMLLTQLLLPLLEETAESSGVTSRIVNVASSCHTFLGVWRRQDPAEMLAALQPLSAQDNDTPAIKDFRLSDFVAYYGLSKLCVVWWTRVLARSVAFRFFGSGSSRQPKVFVACCHPGVITTHLYRDLLPLWVLDRIVYYPSLLIGKTWAEGAQAVLKACVEPENNMVHGGYYMCSGEYGPSSGVNCLSRYAVDMNKAVAFCAWAEEQFNLKKKGEKFD